LATNDEPEGQCIYAKPDFQAISYYSAPKVDPNTLDDVDPELLEMYKKVRYLCR
jgi:Fe-S cluster assembly protein SufB